MIPAAIGKAADLYRFVQHDGSGLAGMELLLTLGEGYELLDWLPGSGLVSAPYMDTLRADIERAKLESDPWIVLEHWNLQGFKLTRKDAVLQ